MRDPNRIPKIISELETLWLKVPDWRLGQLIINVLGANPFYTEDDETLVEIQRWIYHSGEMLVYPTNR